MKKILLFVALTLGGYAQQNDNQLVIPDPYDIHTPKDTMLEQPVLNGDGISRMYFELTGKRVLLSNSSRGVELNIVQPGPITNQEVVELIETQLMMEGFTLVESPGKQNELRLLPLNGGIFPAKAAGVKVITDVNKLPYNDELISYVMRFNYIQPEDAVAIFQTVIGQFGPAASIALVPNSSSIIVTDNALTVRSLIEIQKQIDLPGTNFSTKFVKIIFADSEEVATQLNELINGESAPNNRAGNAPQGRQANQGQRPAATTQTESGPLRVLSDSRTNRITLLGSLEQIARAEALIKEIDIPSTGGGFLRRKLSYLPVGDFIPIAQQAIQATLGDSAGGGGTTPNPGNNNNNNPGNNNPGNNNPGGNQNGTGANLGGSDGNTAPQAQLIGKTLIVADNISNSIIVDGPPHHLEIVENLINELDIKSDQIAITVIFGTYSSIDDFSFSTNAVALFDQLTGSPQVGGGSIPGFSGGDVSNIFTADSLEAFTSAAVTTGLNVGFANTDYGVFVNALKTETNFEEISRPTVFTTNNRAATISSGSRIAIPTGTIFDGGTASTNIQFEDVLLELEVRPLVNNNEEVTVQIALGRDTIGGTRVIDDVETVDINSQSLETIVTVPNKSLIILGGLYGDLTSESQNGIPILSDIPLLGKLFSSESDGEDLEELVIMVYTHVISNNNDLEDYQDEFDQKSYIAPYAREQFHNNELLNRLKKPEQNPDQKPKNSFFNNLFKGSDKNSDKKRHGPKQSHRNR